MAYYRRRSNTLGWLAFFGIGAVVFGGLLVATYYFKTEYEKKEAAAAAATTRTQDKEAKPIDIVKLHLSKKTKEEGKGYEVTQATDPKEVNSGKLGRKVFIINVRWKMTGEDAPKDINDDVFIIDKVGKSNMIHPFKFDDWDRAKGDYQITEDP
ncbi:MAG: hypothetical protein K2R98_32610 [Gemmataceae bacterium]|nr:hypothetical protein [Gemmataceae bacterium]